MVTEEKLHEVYRERARLISVLSKIWHSYIVTMPGDEWDVVIVNSPEGQLSWHIADPDMDLFRHLTSEPEQGQWDGHSTAVKHARMEGMAKQWEL